MDKKQIEMEERETLELFSERIDSATAQCAGNAPESPDGNAAHPASPDATDDGRPSRRAAGKIDEAVSAAQDRSREKTEA